MKVYCITAKDQFQLGEDVEEFMTDKDNIVFGVHYMFALGEYIAFIHYMKKEDWEC